MFWLHRLGRRLCRWKSDVKNDRAASLSSLGPSPCHPSRRGSSLTPRSAPGRSVKGGIGACAESASANLRSREEPGLLDCADHIGGGPKQRTGGLWTPVFARSGVF